MTRTFGKYELIERIGKGGMAEVFLAKSVGARGVEKTLVIKKILPELATNQRFIEMFIAEARIAMGLNHPNIVQIYDFGRVDGDYFLAMEYVEGFELARLLAATREVGQMLPIGDAVYLAMEVARGLDYAHRRLDSFGEPLEIVHRDISPQNLLVTRDGSVKIVDFGIAKATSVADDGPEIVKGKYQYMSPEQAAGQSVDRRSDLFSLGVVLFEMVCGRALFKGDSAEETVSRVVSAVVPDILSINPEVPEQLEHVMYKALARDREERFQSARDLQVELTRVLYGLSDIHDATTVAQHIRAVEQKLPEQTLEMRVDDFTDDLESQTVRDRAPRTVNSGGTPQLPTGQTPALGEGDVQAALSRQRKETVILAGHLEGLKRCLGQEGFASFCGEFQRIVDAIAYKNDAVVHEIDAAGFTLLLGIPISSENDADRAARMAIDLREAIQGMSHTLDSTRELRFGITVGEVLLEHGVASEGRQYSWSFQDDGLERARRLARSSAGQEIYVEEQIIQRIRRTFHSEEVASRRPGESAYFRVLGLKTARDQIQELRRSFQAFYGREIPQRLLRDTFRQALLKERARGVLIVGHTGVGKSTLLEKFLSGLNEREVRVVRVAASQFDSEIPLASARSFFSEMMRINPQAEASIVREKIEDRVQALFIEESQEERVWLAESLFHLYGVSASQGPMEELSGEERRRRLFSTLSRITNRFAAGRPVVLAVDDMHFVDPVMRAFAAQYFDRTQKAPVFFVGTAQDSGPHLQSHSWKALINARNLRVEILGELAHAEAEKMVRNRLRVHGADREELVQSVLGHSGGNPMYIKEVIDVLQVQGRLHQGDTDGIGVSGVGVLPSSLEGVIRARMDGLPLEVRDALQRVSLLPAPFTGADARAVLGPHPVEVLDRLVEFGALRRNERKESDKKRADSFLFTNILIQEVASRGLVEAEARLLHGAIAAHLQEKGAGNDRVLIARHLDAAGEGARAVALYVEALPATFEGSGAAECLRLCERILSHSDLQDEQRFETLLWRERSQDMLGENAGVDETLALLEELVPFYGDPADQAHVAIRRGRSHFRRAQPEEARKAIARALEIAQNAGDRLSMAEAWRNQAAIELTEGHRDRALALIDRSIASLNMKTGARVQFEMVKTYNIRGVILRQSGRHREALEAYETALAGAEALESTSLIRQLLMNSGLALAYIGEFSEAKRRYQRALESCKRLGHRRDEALVLVNLGHVYQMMGRNQRAQAYIQRGIHLARRTKATTTIVDGKISLGLCYLESGELEDARVYLEQGFTRAEAIPHAYLANCALLGLAEVHLATRQESDLQRVIEIAGQALRRCEEAGMMWGVATAHEITARALLRLDSSEQALWNSRKAMEVLEEVEIYGVDQILLTHAEVLASQSGLEAEREAVIEAALKVYESRRDGIDDEVDRQFFKKRPINQKIRRLASSIQLIELSEVEDKEEVVEVE